MRERLFPCRGGRTQMLHPALVAPRREAGMDCRHSLGALVLGRWGIDLPSTGGGGFFWAWSTARVLFVAWDGGARREDSMGDR
jgi:hypothetical protein